MATKKTPAKKPAAKKAAPKKAAVKKAPAKKPAAKSAPKKVAAAKVHGSPKPVKPLPIVAPEAVADNRHAPKPKPKYLELWLLLVGAVAIAVGVYVMMFKQTDIKLALLPPSLESIAVTVADEQADVLAELEAYQDQPHLKIYDDMFAPNAPTDKETLTQWQKALDNGHGAMVKTAAAVSRRLREQPAMLRTAAEGVNGAVDMLPKLEESVDVKEQLFVNFFALEQDSLSALSNLAALLAEVGGAPEAGGDAARLYQTLMARIVSASQQQAALLRAYKMLGEREQAYLAGYQAAEDVMPRNLDQALEGTVE